MKIRKRRKSFKKEREGKAKARHNGSIESGNQLTIFNNSYGVRILLVESVKRLQ